MARGNEGQDDSVLFFMSIRGLKKGEHVFIKQTKTTDVKGVYDESLPNINRVSGRLVKVETKTKVFEGESYEELRFWLKDLAAGESYCLSVGMNGMGRNLINTLASIEGNIGELMISVYTNKTTGFPSLYVEHNGEKVGWKFEHSELKKYIKVTEKKGKDATGKPTKTNVNDYFDLNEFLLKVFREQIQPKVKSVARAAEASAVSESSVGVDGAPLITDGSDDLPF